MNEFVTHSTPYAPYYPAPRRRGVRGWAVALVAVGAGVAGIVLGAASSSGPAASEVPDSCIEALAAAERVDGLSQEAMLVMADVADAASRGVDAAARWDEAELAAITDEVTGYSSELDAINADLVDARSDYDTAAQSCRAEGGELR